MSDHTTATVDEDMSIIHGTGNTFADLNLPNAEERDKKVRLALLIREAVEETGKSGRWAAGEAGIAPSDLSNIMRGRVANFSSDRLMAILVALGNDVDIVVRPKRGARGVVSVSREVPPLPMAASGRD
jgi:predicted XRE-type DNA-binding protein